jgi:hypothetical protein
MNAEEHAMGLKAGAAGVALALALGTGIAVVPSATAEEAPCAGEFAALEVATANATYTSRRAGIDQQGLLDKINAAELKVEQGKLSDAVAKIADYDGKVETLELSGKMTSDADLHYLADVVISCIRSLP